MDWEKTKFGLLSALSTSATSQKSTDGVFSYLSAIGPIRILTREEEIESALKSFDTEARPCKSLRMG
jgi:hypothetical protein